VKPLDQKSLEQLFLNARTFHGWKDQPVNEELIRRLYELMKWAPTCVNGSPVRILFITKGNAEKEKVVSTLMSKNIEKTRLAPVTAIIAEDLHWHKKLPKLMPHADYYSNFAGNLPLIEKTSFRNSSLQGAYLIMAARALGLDCGPMSGFDNDKLDSLFFAGTHWRTNFLCNLGYGDRDSLFPRSPRFEFDEVCKII
jgi:3-hydroxypropanoate dehydrogenase